MVHERAHGWGQPVENPNPEFMALLLNIQRRLNEQAALLQQQAGMIQSLQQQQGRVVSLEPRDPTKKVQIRTRVTVVMTAMVTGTMVWKVHQ